MLDKLRSMVSALPDFCIAGLFWYTWVHPHAIAGDMVPSLVSVFLLEFIVIHSSAFMLSVVRSKGEKSLRVKVILGLGALYSLFAGGFSLAFKSWFPILAFWGLTLNRIMSVILPGANHEEEMNFTTAKWALSTLFYLAGAFLTVFIPWPELGVTHSLSHYGMDGSGLWFDDPERPLAVGGLYFFCLGVVELFAERVKKWKVKVQ